MFLWVIWVNEAWSAFAHVCTCYVKLKVFPCVSRVYVLLSHHLHDYPCGVIGQDVSLTYAPTDAYNTIIIAIYL